MRKIGVFVGLLALAVAGCASDPREAQIRNVLASMETTRSLVSQLKGQIESLTKKATVDEKDVSEINDPKTGTIKKLEEEGKHLSDYYAKIKQDTENRVPTAEELAKYSQKFAGQLQDSMKQLDKETKDMLEQVRQLAAKHPKVATSINKRLRDAGAEYEQSIGR